MLTSNDFTGLFNERFARNFLPIPAENNQQLGQLTPQFQLPDITNGSFVK